VIKKCEIHIFTYKTFQNTFSHLILFFKVYSPSYLKYKLINIYFMKYLCILFVLI
jgi:hypothetical protein